MKLTRNYVLNLAGRGLDALVADIVMDWSVCACGEGSFYGDCGLNYPPGSNTESEVPLYSSEEASAFAVMEKMKYDAGFVPMLVSLVLSEKNLDHFFVLVCRAALLTKLGMTMPHQPERGK